jgi:hypothetical protein
MTLPSSVRPSVPLSLSLSLSLSSCPHEISHLVRKRRRSGLGGGGRYLNQPLPEESEHLLLLRNDRDEALRLTPSLTCAHTRCIDNIGLTTFFDPYREQDMRAISSRSTQYADCRPQAPEYFSLRDPSRPMILKRPCRIFSSFAFESSAGTSNDTELEKLKRRLQFINVASFDVFIFSSFAFESSAFRSPSVSVGRLSPIGSCTTHVPRRTSPAGDTRPPQAIHVPCFA